MNMRFQQWALPVLAALLSISFAPSSASAQNPYYYRIRIFHYKTADDEQRLDHYLRDALLPALHRQHIPRVGVFKPVDQDTDRKIYMLIPFRSLSEFDNTRQHVLADSKYQEDGRDFIDAAYDHVPFTRIEVITLKAFPKWPEPTEPKLTAPKPERVYELRSYESPTEKLNINKVRMFNEGGETALFRRLNFNAVFYGEVLSGSRMPNLMYMTTFENKADRDKHWDTFANDPEWKELAARPDYAHNVSKADILFLHPTAYSDY